MQNQTAVGNFGAIHNGEQRISELSTGISFIEYCNLLMTIDSQFHQ
jgi:hypothetical protein